MGPWIYIGLVTRHLSCEPLTRTPCRTLDWSHIQSCWPRWGFEPPSGKLRAGAGVENEQAAFAAWDLLDKR
jgi:hypothetical protein